MLVAVSGGPDSVCLLHILWQLREKLGVSLHVAHLNHQLRGAESEADARYVAALAHQLGLPATIEARDVEKYQKKHKLSQEEAAREVRYAFLAQVAASIGAERVAVGHTRDDHTETILMHLIRGSGTRGLCGLQPISQWQSGEYHLTVVRPLLAVSREETQAYCREHRLAPRIDSTNLSLSPFRNKIRLQLLPLLESYNPRIAETLLRTAVIAEDEMSFIESEVETIWDKVARIQNNSVVIDKEKFINVHPALKRHLLRMTIERLIDTLKDIEAHHIEDMLAALPKPAGKTIQLPDGLVFSIEYDRYLLGTDPAALSPFPPFEGEFPLNIPGRTQVGNWIVKADIISREQMKQGKDFTAYFDYDKTGDKLTVRTYRTGDRFQPLGMSQPKKLGEFMIDTRIPHAWRQRIPILCSPEQILWVVGYRIDERVKVTEGTERVLRVGFIKTHS